jgi:hypothetical protein
MEYPQVKIQVTRRGVEATELDYRQGMRDPAWKFAEELLPAIKKLNQTVRENMPAE